MAIRKKKTPPKEEKEEEVVEKNNPSPSTWDERLMGRLSPFSLEIFGGVLFLLAILLLLGLPSWGNTGVMAWAVSPLRTLFGWGAYPVLATIAFGGIHIMFRRVKRPFSISASQVIGFELVLLSLLPISHVLSGATLADAYLGKGGGLVGWALSEPLIAFLGGFLAGLFYLILLIWGMSMLLSYTWADMLQELNATSLRLRLWAQRIAPREMEDAPFAIAPLAAPDFDEEIPALVPITPARRPQLPPIDLLEKGHETVMDEAEIDRKTKLIEQTLADFGLPAEVTEVRQGPAVTQFGLLPGYIEKTNPDGSIQLKKVRINQISALQRDLALSLAVTRLRVQAPVPGRGVVGIEVPNDETDVVRLRTLIESDAFQKLDSPMGVGLGRDISGETAVIDLSKMPHLLMAGTTGSGKSVCVNGMISSLIFNNTPDELRLVMIDPKKVELIRFNGVPHLIGHVEVEADRATGVLRWLTAEMDRRYELFTRHSAKNLKDFNIKVSQVEDAKPLPYIAVFIDELADLMYTYPGDIERTLIRLAQMARATGIHLVVATQRPSTDVITGLIKANFPARLSFAVASSIDSRVILDATGAEQLMGKGDMLFLSPEAPAPVRIQGVFVNDLEIERIVEHWQQTMPITDPEPAPWEDLIARHAVLDETDSMLEQAIAIAQKQDELSTSYLQRRMRIGYPRAARLMEHLYEMGLVADPKQGGKTRKTFVGEEDEDPLGKYIDGKDG